MGPFEVVESAPEDAFFMALALRQAERAAALGEVPVGAVLTRRGAVLASVHNSPIASCDPTAHAEVLALRRAARWCDNYRLPGSTLFVTLEPCAMCVGALIHARVERLVFGAREPKAGVVVSHPLGEFFNHRVSVTEGVGAEAAAALLKSFFRARRR